MLYTDPLCVRASCIGYMPCLHFVGLANGKSVLVAIWRAAVEMKQVNKALIDTALPLHWQRYA